MEARLFLPRALHSRRTCVSASGGSLKRTRSGAESSSEISPVLVEPDFANGLTPMPSAALPARATSVGVCVPRAGFAYPAFRGFCSHRYLRFPHGAKQRVAKIRIPSRRPSCPAQHDLPLCIGSVEWKHMRGDVEPDKGLREWPLARRRWQLHGCCAHSFIGGFHFVGSGLYSLLDALWECCLCGPDAPACQR